MEDRYIIKDGTLYHAGVKGMSWGKHLPGTDWWKEKASSAVNSVKNTLSKTSFGRSYSNYMNKNSYISKPGIDGNTGKEIPGGTRVGPSRLQGITATARNMARAGIASAKVSAKNLGKNISNRASYTAYKAKKGTSKFWNDTKGYASEKVANLKKAANTAYMNNKKQVLDFFSTGNNTKSGTISGNTYLDNFVNTQLEQASKAYSTAAINGGAGNLVNSFIQTAQYRISKGVNNYLKSIGMDDEVDRFMSKIFGNKSKNQKSNSYSKQKPTQSISNASSKSSNSKKKPVDKVDKLISKVSSSADIRSVDHKAINEYEKKRNKTRPSY